MNEYAKMCAAHLLRLGRRHVGEMAVVAWPSWLTARWETGSNPRVEPRRLAARRLMEHLRFKGRRWALQPDGNSRYIAKAARLEQAYGFEYINDNGYQQWIDREKTNAQES